MEIKATEALIKTAKVEVKALTIEGKQVTLAVFRQMIEEDLINHDSLEFIGIPWGKVNYHPDKCSGNDHIHIVWQKDDLLRRSKISVCHLQNKINTLESLLTSYKIIYLIKRSFDNEFLEVEYTRGYLTCQAFGWQFYLYRIDAGLDETVKNYFDNRKNYIARPDDFWEKYLKQSKEKLIEFLKQNYDYFFDQEEYELQEIIDNYSRNIEQIKKRWKEIYDNLSKLDQLFIAV